MVGFSWNEAISLIKPLAILALEMVIYSVLIFNYYRFLAKRDIVKFDLDKYKETGDRAITGFLNFIQTMAVYPVILFIWFVFLAAVLGFLGKNETAENILLLSMALISTVRITAYYNEDLSKDLAKMLPFTLLGIFIVDQQYFNFQVSWTLIKSLPENWHLLIYYFVFIFIMELVLRIFWIIKKVPQKKQKDVETEVKPIEKK
jgi:hypothetical protein